MVWNQASTVTVVIHGYQAPQGAALPEVTGGGSLKVSDRMQVELFSTNDPDEFTISREAGTEDIQFVPIGATTTWNWQVTPKYPRKKQTLTIEAWVLYPGASNEYLQQMPAYTGSVDVDASVVTNVETSFWNDPSFWIKYMLPGGAGFLFLASIVTWWRKRRQKQKPG
jgi:hypothetical protein